MFFVLISGVHDLAIYFGSPSSGLPLLIPQPLPVPRQQLVDLEVGVAIDPGEHGGEPGLGINVREFGRVDQAVHGGSVCRLFDE